MEAQLPSWKHWSFSYFYFLPLVGLHIAYIAILGVVQTKYRDAEPEIAAVAGGRADPATKESNMFIFNEADNGAYVLWQFVPVICAVTLGLLWEVVDLSVRRLEPFYQMSRRDGATVQDSLSMSYVHAYSFLVPLTSAWHRHWAVTLSSSIYVIAYSVLPALSGAMWEIKWGSLDTSAPIETQDSSGQQRYATISLDQTIVIAAQAFHAFLVVLALILFLMQRFRRSGLTRDPRGVGGAASLTCESAVLDLFRQIPSYESQDNITASLSGVKFRIQPQQAILGSPDHHGGHSYQIVSDAYPGQGVRPPIKPFQQSRWEAHGTWLSARVIVAVEIFFLCSNSFILAIVQMASRAAGVDESEYKLTVEPTAIKLTYTFVITISAGMWQCVQRELALFEPYRQMALDNRQRPGRLLDTIGRDYISLGVARSAAQSLITGPRSFLVFWSSLSFLAMLIATILLPPIYELLYAVIQVHDDDRIPKVLANNLLVLQVITYTIYGVMTLNFILILWRGRCRPFLPREPKTLSSNLAYICHSGTLLHDVVGTSAMSRREFTEAMRLVEAHCQFGWFYDGMKWFVGIEALPRRVPFVFGNTIIA